MIRYPGILLLAYLLGSIPWGLLLARRFGAVDLRAAGSRNIGTTNVLRTAGPLLAVLTLLGDVSKGALPVWLAVVAPPLPPPWNQVFVAAVALCAFWGHLYPVFLKFKTGGKGVATAAGCFLVISPAAVGIALLIFLAGTGISRRASVGSLAAVAALPPVVWYTTAAGIPAACALVMAAFIYFRHRENIRRLISGTEPALWGRRK